MGLDVNALGTRIAHLRSFRGLSLGSLADAADGMAKSYLAKLEKGEVENPGLKTLNSIARALDVTVADLLRPVELGRGTSGEALLDEESAYGRLMAQLPQGLEDFLQQMVAEGRPVPPRTVRMLAAAEFRGRKPAQAEDWRFLYDALVRSVRS